MSAREQICTGVKAALHSFIGLLGTGKKVRRYFQMAGKGGLGKVLLAGAGILVATGAAAAAGIAAGLRSWAKDEDSDEIKIVLGGDYGLRISKGEKPGDYHVDTKYDWKNDPDFAEEPVEDEEEELSLEEPVCETPEVVVEEAAEAEAPAEEEKPE